MRRYGAGRFAAALSLRSALRVAVAALSLAPGFPPCSVRFAPP